MVRDGLSGMERYWRLDLKEVSLELSGITAFLEEESECKGSEARMCLGHLGKRETSVAGAECNCHPSSQIDGCSKMSV